MQFFLERKWWAAEKFRKNLCFITRIAVTFLKVLKLNQIYKAVSKKTQIIKNPLNIHNHEKLVNQEKTKIKKTANLKGIST